MCSIKKGVLKNFSEFSDKHKKQSSGGVLWKDVLKNFAKFTEQTSWRLKAGNLKLAETTAGDDL